MDLSEQRLFLEEVRQTDMVEYLCRAGYEPVKIRNNDYWYLSPLREEKTPSFKINRKLNRWFDHGMGRGGNIIDFALLYYRCNISEFIEKAKDNLSFHPPLITSAALENTEISEGKISIVNEKEVSSFALYRYLQERKIPIDAARRFCKEITYKLNEKDYFAIGFKNDSGGYELRNRFYKASSSPKDITTINNHANEALVFEGFFDFLSFTAIDKKRLTADRDFVILNSVSFFERARPFMEQHDAIHLYLDRDTTGQNYSRYALSLNDRYQDKSSMYQPCKDVNETTSNWT